MASKLLGEQLCDNFQAVSDNRTQIYYLVQLDNILKSPAINTTSTHPNRYYTTHNTINATLLRNKLVAVNENNRIIVRMHDENNMKDVLSMNYVFILKRFIKHNDER